MKNLYVASLSGGKDSVAMVLKLIEEGYPMDYVVNYDTGVEFKAVYSVINKIRPIIEEYGAKFIVLRPENSFFFDMLIRPVNLGKETEHAGYSWCGNGICRWGTSEKQKAVAKFIRSLTDKDSTLSVIQYIGIAYDEPKRIDYSMNKTYPLVDFKMTEADCLNYCYQKGITWTEEGCDIDLYKVMDRVSCYCCGNKSLAELKAIYMHFPYYWAILKNMQRLTDRPFRRDGSTIFDLEARFKEEIALEERGLTKNDIPGQISIFDFVA